jgi:hypothetical protein
MTSPSTQGKKVVLYDCVTGERFVRWPVDAREMLATGAYSTEPVAVETPLDADALTAAIGVPAGIDVPDPVPHVAAAELLATAQSPTGAPLVIGEVVAQSVGVTDPVVVPTPAKRRR